jgi:hypothetical protein
MAMIFGSSLAWSEYKLEQNQRFVSRKMNIII